MDVVEAMIDTETELSCSIRAALGTPSSLADADGLSEDTLEGLYAYAYDFYENGRLDDAELFFKFLCIYDFTNVDYLKGYAAVCQLKKQYQKACDLYSVAFSISNQNDYSPIYFIGQSQLCMKKINAARDCFSAVVSYSNDNELVNKAKKYLELLKDMSEPEGGKSQNEPS